MFHIEKPRAQSRHISEYIVHGEPMLNIQALLAQLACATER